MYSEKHQELLGLYNDSMIAMMVQGREMQRAAYYRAEKRTDIAMRIEQQAAENAAPKIQKFLDALEAHFNEAT